MAQSRDKDLSLEERQAIFLAVVEEQDKGVSVLASRTEVAKRFSITEEQMKSIEREGSDESWPPLS